MKRLLTALAVLSGIALLGLASLALAGLGARRDHGPVATSVAVTVLLALPVLGIASLFGRRIAGLLTGAIAWPLLLLVGLPLYFPGERREAVQSGLALLGFPLGRILSVEHQEQVSRTVDDLLATPRARPPVPQAQPTVVPPPAPGDPDTVALPYEGSGHSLLVAVGLDGPGERHVEVPMVLDTGSTYTTLDRATLAAAGYAVPDDAPTITFQTATGEATSPIVLADRLWVGGLEVPGVTIAVCDTCADPGSRAGLLGLNVSGRFLLTLDTVRREVVLTPRLDGPLAALDARPWVDLDARGTHWPDGHTEFRIRVRNDGPRPLAEALVRIGCGDATFDVDLGPVGAGEALSREASVPSGTDCSPFRADLARARW
ncbi:MAG: retropepsin-like domain-containing protein [Deltaproteobacteria bacterium]|nr:retropepsin-like domain-containing protein [Deltaproteobacteria bacterium]